MKKSFGLALAAVVAAAVLLALPRGFYWWAGALFVGAEALCALGLVIGGSIMVYRLPSLSELEIPSTWKDIATRLGIHRYSIVDISDTKHIAAASLLPGRKVCLINREALSDVPPGVVDALIAHELAHLKMRGVVLLNNLVANVLGVFSNPILLAVLWWLLPPQYRSTFWDITLPALALLALLRIVSRWEEYRADLIGAALTCPEAMIEALLVATAHNTQLQKKAGIVSRALAFILIPWNRIFASHPSLDARTRRLTALPSNPRRAAEFLSRPHPTEVPAASAPAAQLAAYG